MEIKDSQVKLKKFKKKYGYCMKLSNGQPQIDWSKIKFRPGAPFTTPFFLDPTTWDYLRLHLGIDRGHGAIFNPFDSKMKWYSDYGESIGSLLRIFPVNADFEIRIFHINDLSEEIKQYISNDRIIPGRKYITETGTKGLGTASHSHVEVVSLNEKSGMIDQLIKESYGVVNLKAMSGDQIKKEIENFNDERMTYDSYLKEKKWRKVIKSNHYYMQKIDYIDGKKKTWYNSHKIFNM